MADSVYAEAALYRMLFAERTHDVAFYLRECAGVASVLDLGAGAGRVSIPLAAAGARVVALDDSAAMLAQLTADAPEGLELETELADARTARLGARFDRVTLAFNGLAHFGSPDDEAGLFGTVKAHLAEGGRFVFDSLLPDPATQRGVAFVPRFVHPRTGAVCRLEERASWDPTREVRTITTHIVERESGVEQTLTLSLRVRSDAQIRALLATHGFAVIGTSPLGDAMGYVAERAAA
ncbi:MAG: class I SAM-dependent methyltransferase [Sandaracinaceae bacterium]